MHLLAENDAPPHDDSRAAGGLEFGTYAPATSPATPARKLVVATFNIRYAVGSFLITGSLLRRARLSRPRRRAALVEGNIRKAARLLGGGASMPKPDLIAVQEADRRTARAGRRHVAQELAKLLQMNFVHAPMAPPRGEAPKAKQWYLDFEEHIGPGDAGDTGVALLSRFPVEAAARVELPWAECAWRPRLALTASFPFGRKRLRVFNLHIDPHGSVEERLEQHRAVIAHASEGGGDEPVVLLGDLNTLTRDARDATRRLLEGQGFSTPMPSGVATWRAGLIRLHTDWIFVRGARASRWGVARQRGVSDHWPVWAEIDADD